MKIKFYCILLLLIPAILWGQHKPNRAAREKHLKTYEHSRLGFKFRYYSDLDENFPGKFDVDTTTWQRISIAQFGIYFNSPKPYSIQWTDETFSGNWYDPTDSIMSLDFGGGVVVNIYETQR